MLRNHVDLNSYSDLNVNNASVVHLFDVKSSTCYNVSITKVIQHRVYAIK